MRCLVFFVLPIALGTLARHTDGADLAVLDHSGRTLLRDYLLGEIHAQYDTRRRDVAAALESREALLLRREQLRDRYPKILGPLPEKTPLGARVTGVIEADGYRIEKVVFQSRPHHHVTANLYLPTIGKPPYPGVLVACGHSLEGKAYPPYQSVAVLLAKNGFVALVYDPIGQGERRQIPSSPRHAGTRHKLLNVNSLPVGRNAVHYEAWDGVRGIDYLLARPEVDRSTPVGMTGNSGGGAQTMYLMALDDRIGAAAPSCHVTTLERNFELGGAGDGCQSAPNTGAFGIDHPDFFTIRAPKPTIILAAEQDYKDITFTRKTFREAVAVFRLLGEGESVDMFAYDDKHAFSKPRRQAAVAWMLRWLCDDPRPVTEPELKLESANALQVTQTGQVITEFADAVSVVDLNLALANQLRSAREDFWKTHDSDACLAEIRRLIGLRDPQGAVAVKPQGTLARDGYRIEKLSIEREGQVPVPALLFLPEKLAGRRPAVLYVDGRGKDADALVGGPIEQMVAGGKMVLSIDARGFGETADEKGDAPYAKGDHRVAMWSFHVGRPLLGQRVEDVLTAADVLAGRDDVQRDRIDLVAVGTAGPVGLHAAALGRRFASVTIRESIRSWVGDVVAKPLQGDPIGNVVPSALLKYDLPDLAALLADRLTIQ